MRRFNCRDIPLPDILIAGIRIAQVGAIAVTPSGLVWGSLLALPDIKKHGHDSPLSCIDVSVLSLVRLWTSDSFNIPEVGIEGV